MSTISISEYGRNTAGETYSLVCRSTTTNSEPSITWFDPMNNAVPLEMITSTDSTSRLTFSPLMASQAGNYTCRVMAAGQTSEAMWTVQVNPPGTDNDCVIKPNSQRF